MSPQRNRERLKIIGQWPRAASQGVRYTKAVGTIFPSLSILVVVPGIHITQRFALIDYLNKERQMKGLAPLSQEQEEEIFAGGVDLFFEANTILIRPQPDNMELTFQADELLQEVESKLRIKFLQATNKEVLMAIKKRGECWRINPLPRSSAEIGNWIRNSKTSIGGRPIYYHNLITGTRYLTYESFASLKDLPPEDLAKHLQEIQFYSNRYNQLKYKEVAFFGAEDTFGPFLFNGYDFLKMPLEELKKVYETLLKKFEESVKPSLRYESFDNLEWRNAMYSALISHEEGLVAESILRGLSPEYFMQLEWLPGGRIETGELIFDTVFEEFEKNPTDPELAYICDEKVKSFIFNFIREFGDIEYINIARIPTSLSQRGYFSGYRGVYLAELKLESSPDPVVRIIRMQKWDIAGHLDEGRELLEAMLRAAEYTEYVLDRRLACRQIGMKLPPRILMHKLSEVYRGKNQKWQNQIIWSTYFERDYQPGIATDKISRLKFQDEAYALKFARLLGRAAAPNMIVGRIQIDSNRNTVVLFDDGDEVVIEDEFGMPLSIVVSDPTGSFGDYISPLERFASHYAKPIIKRIDWVKNKEAFIEEYLRGFIEEFTRIKNEYIKKRGAFDALFRHRKWDKAGSLAYRWECILCRLENSDPVLIAQEIRKHILQAVKLEEIRR